MCPMILQELTNFLSKLNCKSFPNIDAIVFILFVSHAAYVVYHSIGYQIQRFNTYYYLLQLNPVIGSTIYNRECCPICVCEFKAPARANCGHAFCLQCLLNYFQYNDGDLRCICPLCRSWIRDFDCLHKFDFSKDEKAKIKKLENELRELITRQNSQIKFVQRFVWIRTNKWKTFGAITLLFVAFIGAIYQFS